MKRKFKVKNLIILFVILIIGSVLIFYLTKDKNDLSLKKPNGEEEKQEEITDFKGMTYAEVEIYVKTKKLTLKVDYQYNEEFEKYKVIDFKLNDNNLDIVVSLGSVPIDLFKEKKLMN